MGISSFLFCAITAGMLTLTGCGGGGSPSQPNPQGTTTSCELPLKYADGRSNGSGYAIITSIQSVPRQFNPCTIQQIESATLGVCIDHPQIDELSAQLILPNNTPLQLDLQSAQTVGAACLVGGKMFSMTLPVTVLQAFTGLQGNWTVGVTDNDQISSTPIGKLVGWSLKVDGTP